MISHTHTYMALGCSYALPVKGSAVLQPPPRVIRQALLLRADRIPPPHNLTQRNHLRPRRCRLLVYGDTSVGLQPELSRSLAKC